MDIAQRWGKILENAGNLRILGEVKAGKCRLASLLIADNFRNPESRRAANNVNNFGATNS